jgi:hypothetical protein
MIDRLDGLLEGTGQPGLCELRTSLREVLGGPGAAGRLIDQHSLKGLVHRLRFEINGRVRSLVVKRLEPDIAQRNQLVAKRWLPAISLSCNGPTLLGVAAERSGQCVWHVYEDLGDWMLDERAPDPGRVAVAVELIAQVHTRFAEHPLLAECRLRGGDLGNSFYISNVRDAIRSLESLQPPKFQLSPERLALRDHLLGQLSKLVDELPYRAKMMEELGGPETLLHGDLWPKNVLVFPTSNGLQARLIDWDHAGVGPVSYDLSAFLSQFPALQRHWILDLYRQSVGRLGWRLPSAPDLNLLFDTAERARLANCVIWPTIAVLESQPEWPFDELTWIVQRLEKLEPVLSLE